MTVTRTYRLPLIGTWVGNGGSPSDRVRPINMMYFLSGLDVTTIGLTEDTMAPISTQNVYSAAMSARGLVDVRITADEELLDAFEDWMHPGNRNLFHADQPDPPEAALDALVRKATRNQRPARSRKPL